jgi:acylphosphatase
VFYRDSTRQVARQLGLGGGVRNLSDGRVEVQVCGDAASVNSLIKWLQIGPKLAKVTNIEVKDCEIDSSLAESTFKVWPTQ